MTDHRPLPDHLCSDNWPMDNVTERSPTPDRETTDTSPTLHIDHLSVDISTESQSTLDRQKDRHINRLDRYSGRYVKLFFSRCVSGRYSTNLEIWLVPLEGSILPSGPLKRAVSHPCVLSRPVHSWVRCKSSRMYIVLQVGLHLWADLQAVCKRFRSLIIC